MTRHKRLNDVNPNAWLVPFGFHVS